MLSGGHSHMPLIIDYAVRAVLFVILVIIATRMYPRLTE